MYYFIFSFIFFIISRSQVKSSTNYNIVGDVREAYNVIESNYKINKKLIELPEYSDLLNIPYHVSIKSKKILYIDFESYQKVIGGSIYNLKLQFHLSTTSYPNTMIIPPYINRKSSDFTLQNCEFGLIIMDDQIDHNKVMISNELLTVDYGILILLKTTNNRIHYTIIPYFSHTFFIYLCPYKNYTREYSNIHYIPNEYVVKNGIFHPDDKEQSHLFIPIFPKTINDDFFICGTLRQPTLPDITLGFKIKNDPNKVLKEKNGAIIRQVTEGCINIHDKFELSYIYLDENSQLTNRKIFVNRNKNNNIYFNQKIYVYNIKQFNMTIFKDPKSNSQSLITPQCLIKTQKKNFFIVPYIDNMKIITQKNNRILFINDIDSKIKFYAKCVSEIIDEKDKNFKEYYSMATKILIAKNDSLRNGTYKEVETLTLFKNKIDSYGKYICNISKKIKKLNTENIQVKSVYFLPQNYLEILLPPLEITYTKSSYPYCKRFYPNIGKLFEIKAINSKGETIGLFEILHSTANFEITLDVVNFTPSYYEYKTTITCKYKTIADTFFLTTQIFSIVDIIKNDNITIYNSEKNLLYPGINISKYFTKIESKKEEIIYSTLEERASLFFLVPLIILGVITVIVIFLLIILIINQIFKSKKINECDQFERINDI